MTEKSSNQKDGKQYLASSGRTRFSGDIQIQMVIEIWNSFYLGKFLSTFRPLKITFFVNYKLSPPLHMEGHTEILSVQDSKVWRNIIIFLKVNNQISLRRVRVPLSPASVFHNSLTDSSTLTQQDDPTLLSQQNKFRELEENWVKQKGQLAVEHRKIIVSTCKCNRWFLCLLCAGV